VFAFNLKNIHVMPQVEQADPGLANTASVRLRFRSSPAQCPYWTTGMCAPDHRRAGGRSTDICHATLLPGRTPRGGGRRYRRRDGVCRFGGRRRRVPAHMHAISSQAGRHFSSPLLFRGQRLTHPNPGEGVRVAIAVRRQPRPPPTPPPSPRRRRPPRELSPPSPQMRASTCRAVEAAAHPHRHRVDGRERRTEGELTVC